MKRTDPNLRGHLVGTDFCEVAADDSEVESVEEEEQPEVHGALGLDEKKDVETKESTHDDKVSDDADGVAELVD